MILNAKNFKTAIENAKKFTDKKHKATDGVWLTDNTVMSTDFNIYYKEKIDNMSEDICPIVFLNSQIIQNIMDYLKTFKKDKSDFIFELRDSDILIDNVSVDKIVVKPEEMPVFPGEEKELFNSKYSLSGELLESFRTLFFNNSSLKKSVKNGFYESRNYSTFVYLINDKAMWTNGHLIQEISNTGLSDINILLPVDMFLKCKKFTGEFSLSYYTYKNKDDKEITAVTINNGATTIAYQLPLNGIRYPEYSQISGIIDGVKSEMLEYEKDSLLKEAILSKKIPRTKESKPVSTINLKVETSFNFDYLNFILSFFKDKVRIISNDENQFSPVVFKGERLFVLMPLR